MHRQNITGTIISWAGTSNSSFHVPVTILPVTTEELKTYLISMAQHSPSKRHSAVVCCLPLSPISILRTQRNARNATHATHATQRTQRNARNATHATQRTQRNVRNATHATQRTQRNARNATHATHATQRTQRNARNARKDVWLRIAIRNGRNARRCMVTWSTTINIFFNITVHNSALANFFFIP